MQEGQLYTHKSDQVMTECRPLRRGLQLQAVMASWYMSEGHFGVRAQGAANWWQLLEKVAIIIIVDLLCLKEMFMKSGELKLILKNK